jgi:thiamine-phosphate pyrophosphorylase
MIIVISSQTVVKNEHNLIHQLFEEGLDMFHVYRPNCTTNEIEKFLRSISSQHHNKVVMHEHYLKFHSIAEMQECKQYYDYAFISPVFDSISKPGHRSSYDVNQLKIALMESGKKIIALGGVDEHKIQMLHHIGFYGIALLGAIWSSNNPVEKFKLIKEKWITRGRMF